jgi:streptomycin 3"-adenylyltransferase
VLSYAQRLAEGLITASGGVLDGAYVHGSAVLGGWVPGRSDVDMLFVVGEGADRVVAERMGRDLCANAAPCPGRELECSVVTSTQARRPTPPWPFVLHVVAGSGQPEVVHPGGDVPGDTDLLMHYAVCRAAGWAVSGPPAHEVFGPVPRSAILAYLADEMRWGIDHGPEAYAVLNACRALVYLTDNEIVSKIAGGETALARGTGPAPVIARALSQQRGREPDRQPGPAAAEFALATAAALRAAAG